MEVIVKKDLTENLEKSYIDYAMSVITSRAVPQVADGCKPVARRILYSMYENKLFHNSAPKKSATVVGNVMASYHAHGDASIYNAAIRMSQPWKMRYPLLMCQGNNGSIDNDDPASMRYTELKLTPLSEYMFQNMNLDVVDFQDNYDGSTQEPVILPALFPQLLANGTSGIAVGMATSIPSHNLTELIESIKNYIDGDIDKMYESLSAPDFPTGGIIVNSNELKKAYETGSGRAVLRGKYKIEKNKTTNIVFYEIPYQMSKPDTTKKIMELSQERTIKGITNIFDESDRDGIRYVIELSRKANVTEVLDMLFKYTQLQKNISFNMVGLDGRKPMQLNLEKINKLYVDHNLDLIFREAVYSKSKAEKRINILKGYLIALEAIDKVIAIIKKSASPAKAKINLIDEFNFNEEQVKAILNLKLQRLTALEKASIENEHSELKSKILEYNKIIQDRDKRKIILKDRLNDLNKKFGDKRKTELKNIDYKIDLNKEKEREEIVERNIYCSLNTNNEIKVLNNKKIRRQNRNGKGVNLSKEDDLIFFDKVSTKNKLYLISNLGNGYVIPIYKIYEDNQKSAGMLSDYVKFKSEGEEIIDAFEYIDNIGGYILLLTKDGIIKKSTTEEMDISRSGATIINLSKNDEIVDFLHIYEDKDIIVYNDEKIIKFHTKDVRDTGRNTKGVIAMKSSSPVKGMNVDDKEYIIVSTKGYGKKISGSEFSPQGRGGKGKIAYKKNDRTGEISKILTKNKKCDIIIYDSKKIIKIADTDISELGRNAVGVKLFDTNDVVKNARIE